MDWAITPICYTPLKIVGCVTTMAQCMAEDKIYYACMKILWNEMGDDIWE